jgi:ectoine hydroxylase-related dioxygenase (phytanoyl-CoA dioxygenase family)
MSETVDNAIAAIREHGYCRIDGLFGADEIAPVLDRVRQLAEAGRALEIRDIPRLDSGQETIYNLQNKDVRFLHLLLKSDTIRTVLMQFLNDQWHRAIDLAEPNYILRSYSARNNRVAAPMHIDSFIPYVGEHAVSMQVAIILEDQDANNGCTTVIPGSHQSGEYTTQDEAANAVPVESRAGDVVIWDSRIWHGTLENRSGASRWSLIATFVRWWVKQGYRITENLPQPIYEQLANSEKAVLGFCSRPLDDEQAGIDFKKGYDWLKPDVDDY